MPFYYDIHQSLTTNGTTQIESTHLWGKTIANQQLLQIVGVHVAARFATAGGGAIRVKTNAGATASGGTAQTPAPRNNLFPAAQSVWANDGSAITPGATLTIRQSIGFAQAGGHGAWVASEPEERIALQANATNPVDAELTSIAVGVSVPVGVTTMIVEGN